MIVSEGVLSIGSRTFADSSLTGITLPESLCAFGISLFDHSDNVVVYVIEGSKLTNGPSTTAANMK